MSEGSPTALTVVVPVGPSPIGEAVQRAYEHLVASDLVRPCVWVHAGSDGAPLAVWADDPAVGGGNGEAAHESGPQSPGLLDVLADLDPSRIRVVALGLPGDQPGAGQGEDLCDRVWRAILDNAATSQEITYYNLLVPSLDSPPGQPAVASLDRNLVRGDPWFNVVVSPEDRADDDALAVPMPCGPSFAFHAASALASLCATWAGMDDGPVDAWRAESRDEILHAGSKRVVVMRSRSRSLVVPTTADTAPGMVLARRANWPVPPGATRPEHRHSLVGEVHRFFMAGPGQSLGFNPPDGPRKSGVTSVTIGQLFTMVWRWVTRRLPEIAKQEISSRIISAADRMEDWVTARVLGPESAFRVDRRNREGATVAAIEAERFLAELEASSGYELIKRTPPPDPHVWSSLRSWSFALVDGTTGVPELDALLTDGSRRVVMTTAGAIAPDGPAQGWWTPPESLREGWTSTLVERLRSCDVWTTRQLRASLQAGATPPAPPSALSRAPAPPHAGPLPVGPPPSTPPPGTPPPVAGGSVTGAIADVASAQANGSPDGLPPPSVCAEAVQSLDAAVGERSGTLLWRIGTSMADAMDAARLFVEQLIVSIDNPPGDSFLAQLDAERRAARRRLIAGLVIATLLAGVALWLVPRFLDGPTPLIPVIVVTVLVWLALCIGAIWRFVAYHFQLEHRKEQELARYERAVEVLPEVLTDLSRLHLRYQQFLDWSEVIGTMVHQPFGPPLSYRGRMHGTWLGGLHAHQVGEGEMGAETLTALVSSQSREVFGTSWLTRIYGSVEEEVTGRFRQLAAATAEEADPDLDNTGIRALDPLAQRSSRSFLLSRVLEGQVTRDLRARTMRQIMERLSALEPSDLCDSVGEEDPSRWLAESIPQEQAAAFTNALWTEQGLMQLPTVGSEQVTRRSVWLPPALDVPPGVEARVTNMAPNADSLVATVVCVDFSRLVEPEYLAVFGHAPTPPVDRVPIPPPATAGMARALVAFTGTGPDPALLPGEGSVIAPLEPVGRPTATGSFAFLAMVEGRPARYPEGVPVPYFLRTGTGPDDAYTMVTAALQEVANASGLSFSFAGTFSRLEDIADDSGGLWVAFVDPSDIGDGGNLGLGDGVLGHGGVRVEGDAVLGGRAVIGNDGGAAPGFGPGHTLGSVILHELGHAMNLGHVNVDSEQMYPVATSLSPPSFGPGDRVGLWLLGVGRGST